MGTVLLGRSPDGRLVAVKMLRAEHAWDTEFRGRFRSEVNRAREVPGFCTAAVLDADPDHETPYLVSNTSTGRASPPISCSTCCWRRRPGERWPSGRSCSRPPRRHSTPAAPGRRRGSRLAAVTAAATVVCAGIGFALSYHRLDETRASFVPGTSASRPVAPAAPKSAVAVSGPPRIPRPGVSGHLDRPGLWKAERTADSAGRRANPEG